MCPIACRVVYVEQPAGDVASRVERRDEEIVHDGSAAVTHLIHLKLDLDVKRVAGSWKGR